MNARSSAFSNTLFSSVSIYVEYFLGMFTSIFIARYMGPSDYGVYGLIIWLTGLGIALTNAGIASGTIKFVAELRGNGRTDLLEPMIHLLRRLQKFTMIVVLIVGATIFLLAGKRLAPDINHLGFGLLLLSIALRAPYMLNVAIAKGFENFRRTAVIAAIAAPINLALTIAAILLHFSMEGFVAVYALMGLVFFGVSKWQVRGLVPASPGAPPLPAELRSRLNRYLILVIMNMAVSFFSASGIEILFLNMWDTSAGAGHFRVAYQLATSASLLVPGVFAVTMLPMMARSLSENAEIARRRWVLATGYLLILGAPVTAFGVAFAPTIIGVLYGEAYRPAGFALAWCLAACSLGAIATGAGSLLISADRQGSVLALTLAAGAIKLTIGAFLTARFGLAGAVASVVLVTSFHVAGQFWLAIRISGAHLPWLHYLRTILATAIAMSPAFAAAHWLRPWPALIVGGMALVVVYAASTLLIGCWSKQDIDYMRTLVHRIAGGRAPALERLLVLAQTRASRKQA